MPEEPPAPATETQPASPALLTEAHYQHLKQSALTDAIIQARGYRTVTSPGMLRSYGFTPTQAKTAPGILIPLWMVDGTQLGHSFRPDTPRIVRDRPNKYESVFGALQRLDCHPHVREALANPQIPLWITEGVKKGDALASLGLCAIALNGVWGFRGRNEHGGTTVVSEWGQIALNGREVRIIYDNDVMRKPEVHKALEALALFLRSKQAQVRFGLLPEDDAKIGVDDYLAAGHTLADLEGLLCDTLPIPRLVRQDARPDLPAIEQERANIVQVVQQAERALRQMPGAPLVFQRMRKLVWISPTPPAIPGLTQDSTLPLISFCTSPRLRQFLGDAANWYSTTPRSRKWYQDMPLAWVIEDLLSKGQWDFPVLTGLCHTPTIRLDGSILDKEGYDPTTGLFLARGDLRAFSLPDAPTQAEAHDAYRVLAEPFCDFPFAQPHHASAALALILSLLARFAVKNVPLFAVRSTVRGSGKGLLTDVVSLITLGRTAPKMPQVTEEEEERKRLFSIAMTGMPFVVIDDVKTEMGSRALDSALTSQMVLDRFLGKNEMGEAPMWTVFASTGNNIGFRGDLARRVVPIDLAPEMEHPEARTNFQHPDLEAYVLRYRHTFVRAGLLILKAYMHAGAPGQNLSPYGSFTQWSDLVRQSLVWAGAPDPCLGREGLEAASDEGYQRLATLLEAWWACYKGQPWTITEIIGHLQRERAVNGAPLTDFDALHMALGELDERFDGDRINARRVGKQLSAFKGRIVNHRQFIIVEGNNKNGTKWAIRER